MKRTLAVILAATLTVNFCGVVCAAEPAQDVGPGLEKQMEEMKQMPEQKKEDARAEDRRNATETNAENAVLMPPEFPVHK